MFKWIAGVLASLIAGVGVWFITEKAWPVDSPPSVGALKTEARLSSPSSDGSRRLIGTFQVRNDGAKTVENCKINFDGRSGRRFSLAPAAVHGETITGGKKYRAPTIAAVQATLRCGNFSKQLNGKNVIVNDNARTPNGRPAAIGANARDQTTGSSN